jgi:hypothetical protein
MKKKPIAYSQAELNWVKENCTLTAPNLHAQFCEKFNRDDVSKDNIVSLRKRNGWKTGRSGRFEKGNIPPPSARPKGPNKGSFKKGMRPHNHLPVGSKVTRSDGYIQIKTAEPNKWQLLHIMLWEKNNGPVPEGKVLSFIDDEKSNCKPENLELITRQESLQINRIDIPFSTPETRQTVKIMGKLIAKTHAILKAKEARS